MMRDAMRDAVQRIHDLPPTADMGDVYTITAAALSEQYDPAPYIDPNVRPGEFLREALAERCMSQSYLAFATGYSLKHINQVMQGYVRISAAVALAIERETDIDARTLLHLQADRDLEEAQRQQVVS